MTARRKIDLSALKVATDDELAALGRAVEAELASRKTAPVKPGAVITHTDGASRGNPGPAGIGAIVFDSNGEKLTQDFRYIDETTNNEAEYRALILALDLAWEITQDTVECYMDSELVVKQLKGEYQVKSEKMAQFNQEVRQKAARFRRVTFTHVPREHPRQQLADKLANKAIDEAHPPKKTRLPSA